MVSKLLYTEMDGTPEQICFADHAGDFNPTAANDLQFSTPTESQITLANLANSSARQSAKVDLGANWATAYKVRAAFEFASAPTAGLTVGIFWAPSSSSTAANGNAGGVSGSDAAYAGYSSNLAASVLQLDLIGVFVCTTQATATIQIAEIGFFTPSERYGTLIIKNDSGQAFHTDDVECHVVFDPIIPESQ